jgi:hypothetical protein
MGFREFLENNTFDSVNENLDIKAPYNKDELLQLGLSDNFINFLITNEKKYKSLSKLNNDFVNDLAKSLGLSNLIIINEKAVFSNINSLFFAKYGEDTKAWLNIPGVAKAKLKLAYVIDMSKDIVYTSFIEQASFNAYSKQLKLEHFSSGAKFIEKHNKEIYTFISNKYNRVLTYTPLNEWLRALDFSKTLITEVEFAIYLISQLIYSGSNGLKKGDIYFGIGDTRRKMYDKMISFGFIKDVKKGSTILVYLSDTEIKLDKTTIAKDAVKKIEKESLGDGPSRVMLYYGLGLEGETIHLYYSQRMASRFERHDNGAPTNEYDDATRRDEKYWKELANDLSRKYNVPVVAKLVAFAKPTNLVYSA